jgi:hypothetical protein
MIREITIVTAQGVKAYTLGQHFHGKYLHSIKQESLYFTGDPYDHYIGRSKDGEMLFSINCLVPCVVEYLAEKKETG